MIYFLIFYLGRRNNGGRVVKNVIEIVHRCALVKFDFWVSESVSQSIKKKVFCGIFLDFPYRRTLKTKVCGSANRADTIQAADIIILPLLLIPERRILR